MGRPKGSKNKPKVVSGGMKETSNLANERVVLRPVMTDTNFVNEDGVLYEKKVFYSFKSRIPGLIHYPGDDGSPKKIDGMSIRDDISPKERKFIIEMDAYKQGLVVEWNVNEPQESSSYNALNDVQMERLCDAFLKDGNKEALNTHIRNMDSIFALSLLKEKIIEKNLPGSVLAYCDGRIKELEEEEVKKMEAPIADKEK